MPKRKHPGGRPTKMGDSTLQKLREAFLMGCTDVEACLFADISPATLYNYQVANPEYLEQKQAWKENPILTARKTVVEALPEDKELAFKFLERKRRDEFGPKQEIGLTGNIIISVSEGDAECL